MKDPYEMAQSARHHGYQAAIAYMERKQQSERNASLTWHAVHTGLAVVGLSWSLYWWLKRRRR